MAEATNLTGVLDQLDDKADGKKLTVDDMMHAFGGRGFGPLILAAALIEILPTGAIPGVPTLVAIAVVLFSIQLVLGRSCPWLPEKLRRKGFDREKFAKARSKVKPVTERIDRVLKPRLHPLISPFAARIVGGVCILMAITMPPLEIVPFMSSVPAAAIALLAVGLTARDGLVVLLGLIAAVGGFITSLYFLL